MEPHTQITAPTIELGTMASDLVVTLAEEILDLAVVQSQSTDGIFAPQTALREAELILSLALPQNVPDNMSHLLLATRIAARGVWFVDTARNDGMHDQIVQSVVSAVLRILAEHLSVGASATPEADPLRVAWAEVAALATTPTQSPFETLLVVARRLPIDQDTRALTELLVRTRGMSPLASAGTSEVIALPVVNDIRQRWWRVPEAAAASSSQQSVQTLPMSEYGFPVDLTLTISVMTDNGGAIALEWTSEFYPEEGWIVEVRPLNRDLPHRILAVPSSQSRIYMNAQFLGFSPAATQSDVSIRPAPVLPGRRGGSEDA